MRDFNDNFTRKKSKSQTLLLSNLLKNNISAEVIHEFTKPELWETDGITDSDHIILKTSWRINLRAKPRRKKKTTRKYYQYDKTLEEDWTEFRKFINEKLVEGWKIEEITNECIMQINKELEYIKRETEHKILIVSAMFWHTVNNTKLEQQINEHRKALNKARKKNSIITDMKKIKKEVEKYFSKWTDTNPPATPIWQDWIAEYNPSEQIDPAAEVLSGVVIDRKKKIHAAIGELLEGRIHKEEKYQGDIRNFYLSGREQTILTITKQFPEIIQEL
ncbi:10538_t:CDS:2 [Gigaspora margarita]|uniref:10538_t:CDS:1 n=1 Tax=Gigaspora margarita TaxID=4874 RepID=A0ABN7UMC9_GIGMA|nr:10538_t:CDS:2 [Gigaspora margarita]